MTNIGTVLVDLQEDFYQFMKKVVQVRTVVGPNIFGNLMA